MASLHKSQEVRDVLNKMSRIYKTRERLYAQIGHAVSSFSAVEHGLLALLFVCSDKLTDEECTKAYSSIGWIKSRIILVDYAVRMKATEEEVGMWMDVKKILYENKAIRDFASHYHVEMSFDDDRNPIGASLRRPEYSNAGRKADERVSQEQLESACAALDKLHGRIIDLLEKMGERIYG